MCGLMEGAGRAKRRSIPVTVTSPTKRHDPRPMTAQLPEQGFDAHICCPLCDDTSDPVFDEAARPKGRLGSLINTARMRNFVPVRRTSWPSIRITFGSGTGSGDRFNTCLSETLRPGELLDSGNRLIDGDLQLCTIARVPLSGGRTGDCSPSLVLSLIIARWISA
jgi:hypothetical protein